MRNFYDILIIGGGASGIASAITAKMTNPALEIAIVEKLPRVGKKILATGNGRCNILNTDRSLERFHGENIKFAMSALSRMNTEKMLDFFANLGILTREEEGGKIYPSGGQASSVLDLLRLRLEKLGIPEITEFEVAEIKSDKGKFTVKSKSGQSLLAKLVIVCAGGAAGPQFGTDGSAYKLLEKLGHSKTKVYPALTRLKSTTPWARSLGGVKFDGKATLKADGKIIRAEEGEILFTDYGLSGPPILQLSGEAINMLERGKITSVFLDLMPQKSEDELKNIIKMKININPDMPLEHFFAGMMNKQIGKILIKSSELGKLTDRAESLTDKKISAATNTIKAWEFKISGHTGWRDAQTTAGGIKTSGIYPSTMESRIVPGLFIAGEIVDIYGDCGGFNLMWAWASGYLAGISAAERLLNE